MPVKRRTDSQQNSDISMEEALQTQIGENVGASPEIKATEQAVEEQNNASQYIGTKLTPSSCLLKIFSWYLLRNIFILLSHDKFQ